LWSRNLGFARNHRLGVVMRNRLLACLAIGALALGLPVDASGYRRAADEAAPARQELAYGGDPLQKLDFYAPAAKASGPAPLIVFVHGGGWKRGDKSNATGAEKIAHFTVKGYAFASIDYRLVPNATVEQQAADIAGALAMLVRDAARLGIDPSRIVLMGHSAGAHLAGLVGTDPRYLQAAGLGVDRLKGVILLDGAAYDVPAQMSDGPRIMQSTYAAAFGSDPARQRTLSPTLQAAAPNAPAFLILHVERDDGARQSEALGAALKAAGARVEIRGLQGRGLRGHMAINRSLGDPAYEGTPIVDAWLDGIAKR
jgi:arylformamidase